MQTDNAFWRFSLWVYAAPGVADECLLMQDRYGVDVNVLLFCAWVAVDRGVVLAPGDVEACKRHVAEWRQRAVEPLRAARRALKGLSGAEQIRVQVKSLELEAEKLQHGMLFVFASQRWPQSGGAKPAHALRANLDAFLQMHGVIGADAVPALLAAAGSWSEQ